jgi:hypothetical protein
MIKLVIMNSTMGMYTKYGYDMRKITRICRPYVAISGSVFTHATKLIAVAMTNAMNSEKVSIMVGTATTPVPSKKCPRERSKVIVLSTVED